MSGSAVALNAEFSIAHLRGSVLHSGFVHRSRAPQVSTAADDTSSNKQSSTDGTRANDTV